MALNTLEKIITKVRRLTRSPSTAQLSEDQIKEYINTAYLYDFPETLRLISLRKTLTFFTEPNVDKYETSTVVDNPLYNFKNLYVNTDRPIYVAGYNQYVSQDRTQFYNLYPRINFEESIGTGDGATDTYSGTLTNLPILQNNVTFSGISTAGVATVLVDVPVLDATTGIPTQDGNLYPLGSEPTTAPTVITPTNTINYFTGVYSITFNTDIGNGDDVQAQYVPYVAGRPTAVLLYDNAFYFRQVPDDIYRVELDVYVQPTELLATAHPELDQWSQYLAYLAAKKVFEDRMDIESVQQIMPELKNQERLVLRRTLVQQTKQRTSTIYTDQVDRSGWRGWGNNF